MYSLAILLTTIAFQFPDYEMIARAHEQKQHQIMQEVIRRQYDFAFVSQWPYGQLFTHTLAVRCFWSAIASFSFLAQTMAQDNDQDYVEVNSSTKEVSPFAR